MRRLIAFARLPVLAASLAVGASLSARAEGMPQLDFANHLTLAQVLWLAVIFAALYLLLSRWALPQVGAVLEQRAAAIAGDLETARLAKAQADAAVDELTRATRESQAAAAAQVADAVARAQGEAAQAAASQNAALEAQLAAAEQRIGTARQSALAGLRQVAAETAGAIIVRLTGQAPDVAAVNAAVSDALAARAEA